MNSTFMICFYTPACALSFVCWLCLSSSKRLLVAPHSLLLRSVALAQEDLWRWVLGAYDYSPYSRYSWSVASAHRVGFFIFSTCVNPERAAHILCTGHGTVLYSTLYPVPYDVRRLQYLLYSLARTQHEQTTHSTTTLQKCIKKQQQE